MLWFKLGAVLGFAAGWAVGSGRAAKLWDELTEQTERPVTESPLDRTA